MMKEPEIFYYNNEKAIEKMIEDEAVRRATREWCMATDPYQYGYHFEWLGRPIIQYPQDIVALQEIIWETKPDLIIETGIARGGSMVFYASMMQLLGSDGMVLGIDIDIREHNRVEIEKHPLFSRIIMIEGSSIDENIVKQVKCFVQENKRQRVMLVLDSCHTHEHVLQELELYTPLVTEGCYCVVCDTIVEDMGDSAFGVQNRPWGKGNNPKTAVFEFLKRNDRFEIDKKIENKLLITVSPDGYLKCVKDESVVL